MRRPLLLILEFVALTVPLTWVWVSWAQEAYTGLLATIAGPVLEIVGVGGVAESPAVKRFVNYVPFLVLMLITPGLSWRRRLVGTAVGLPVLFLGHVGLVAIEGFAQTDSRPTQDVFSTVLPAALLADALPFILWAVVAQRVLRDAFARALRSGAATEGN